MSIIATGCLIVPRVLMMSGFHFIQVEIELLRAFMPTAMFIVLTTPTEKEFEEGKWDVLIDLNVGDSYIKLLWTCG